MADNGSLNIKLFVLGTEPKKLELHEGATVEDALKAVGASPNLVCQIDSAVVPVNTVLAEGQTVYAAQNTKGGC